MNLNETVTCGDLAACCVARLAVRRDECHDRYGAGVRFLSGECRDATNVLVTVRLGEPQVARDRPPEVVSVEYLDCPVGLEPRAQGVGQGRLAGPRESCQPHDCTARHRARIVPAATVSYVFSSIKTNAPVARLRSYAS